MSSIRVGKIESDGGFLLPSYAGSSNYPAGYEGLMIYDPTSGVMIYNGNSWVSLGGSESPADSGSGGGWSISQGANGDNVTEYTNNNMVQFKFNVDNQGASNSATALSYSSGCPGGNQFCYHTGHQLSWWPMYHAINVTTADKGKVLNQIQWQTHINAIGNVDIFGSNNNITQSNFTSESLYTHLGRMHFGGSGGGSTDCTVYTRTFNPNNYGYKWYLIKGVDNQSSALSYPSVGSQGGWAMYRLRLNKI